MIAAEPITDVDTTAADMLADLDEELNAAGTSLVFAELKDPVRAKLERYELIGPLDPAHFFPTLDAAVDAFPPQDRRRLDFDHGRERVAPLFSLGRRRAGRMVSAHPFRVIRQGPIYTTISGTVREWERRRCRPLKPTRIGQQPRSWPGYEKELARLHGELVKSPGVGQARRPKVCIVFEGADGAGKGGVPSRPDRTGQPARVPGRRDAGADRA